MHESQKQSNEHQQAILHMLKEYDAETAAKEIKEYITENNLSKQNIKRFLLNQSLGGCSPVTLFLRFIRIERPDKAREVLKLMAQSERKRS